MAIIDATKIQTGIKYAHTYKWVLGGDDTVGAPLMLPNAPDKTITVSGTFNSATCTIQYSNDGETWFTATLVNSGLSLALTVAGGGTITENALYIRPIVSSGTGVSLKIIITASDVQE